MLPTANLPAQDSQTAGRGVLGINIARGPADDSPVAGVLIVGVTPGGPADEAGLVVDDVLVSIGDVSLTADSAREANRRLLDFMSGVAPGDEVAVAYLRDGDSRTATVTAGELDPSAMQLPPFVESLRRFGEEFEDEVIRPMAYRWRHQGVFAGMELVSLTPDLGKYFGTSEGLLLVRAPRDETIGLRDGDVILALGARTPRDPGHAMRILRSYEPGEELSIRLMRDRRESTVTFRMPEAPDARDES